MALTLGWCLTLIAAAFGPGIGWPAASVQEPETTAAQAEILSPGEDSYVSGPTLLRARVDPTVAVSAVVFFVDGRQACVLTTLPFECDWDAGPSIREHQIRLVVIRSGGGRTILTRRTKALDYAERVDVDVVQVTVTVMDAHGRFVAGLPQSAFHVSEDGRPQPISHFASENVPLEVIVAVDISGSMGPAMPRLKNAVKDFLGAVPSQHAVTLLAFNDSLFTLIRRATSVADRLRAVDRLAPWGSTALYDAILRGVEMLGRQTGRKALIVFSDGEDQGSHSTIADVERRLQASDVTLYAIGQGRGVTLEPLKRILQRLASPTGGRALFTESLDELDVAFNLLLDELSHQYLLGYPPTNSKRDDTWRSIKVDVEGRFQVRARQGYRASPTK